MDISQPSSFPYCESGAYGLEVTYPKDNLPYATKYLVQDFDMDIHFIKPLDIEKNEAMMNRVRGIALYKKLADDEIFINSHWEGPLAEYCDLRGATDGFMDLYDYDYKMKAGVNIMDVDSLVKDIENIIPLLGEKQVLCGNIDPVRVIKNGTVDQIDAAVKHLIEITNNKCIISAGC